ncbi:type 4a pilus biogenesis protein PilO [Massilia oculi]|uniref:Type 4a pilus biogenesis protein PilO n=1 Tax=Massilia hydrophila TaxID=3044279 RepID=A0ABS7Y8T4_9BURK|nr:MULTISPECIES: type 4a pilus biogenesis protein PilO [Massilia]MCA1247426.1 type 4a pilus biogenesis protein PilO [Massilia sp. MS-15]MCA1856112.1 type 4a pilus biogenesis protein PilO [Massilia oculi]
MNIDLKDLGARFAAQFQDLQGRQPGQWPLAPRLLCAAGVMAAVVGLGYFFYWDDQFTRQKKGASEEASLRTEYRSKMAQAINLEALQQQKVQVDQYVERLEKQLPNKSEMADLLSDINQAGVGRGLQFELFKPGAEVIRDYYAEQPIDIKVTGKYNDVGAFAADMANLPRIVTLNNMAMELKDGVLSLQAVAKTFRYLDPDEISAQKKARDERKGKGKKGKKGKGKDADADSDGKAGASKGKRK